MRALLLAASLSVLLVACGSQPPAPEQNPAGLETRTPKAVDDQKVMKVEPELVKGNDLAMLKDPKSPLSKRNVFFDLDSYVIKDEFQSLLAAHGKFLMGSPKMKMLIQGNGDERGSREYNLALAQKRSDAVKKTLSLLGVREDQMESVSLGKEKPVCSESNEECWSKNRRAEMLYSGEY